MMSSVFLSVIFGTVYTFTTFGIVALIYVVISIATLMFFEIKIPTEKAVLSTMKIGVLALWCLLIATCLKYLFL